MYIVGITGGIGSGKTTVSDLFSELGVKIIDADVSARAVVEPGQAGLADIVEEFGQGILHDNGTLNRPALRDIVFANPDKRLALEAITHPAIRRHMLAQLNDCNDPYAILVLPLLVDTGQWEMMIDRVLVVDIDEQTQLERVMERDNLSEEQVNQIFDAQISREERLAAADDIIINNHGLDHLRREVAHYHGIYSIAAQEGESAVIDGA